MHNCILLRYGEIGLKSKRTRFAFEKKYVQAIEEALKRNGITNFNIQNFGGRFVIFSNQVENILPILNRISGIQSFSPAANSFFSSKEDLLKGIKKYGVSLVQGKTFAVRVKRIGKHEFNSKELEKEGYLREVLRRIQSLRKKEGLNVKDRILLNINSDYDLSGFKDEIENRVGSEKVTFNWKEHRITSLEKIKGKKFGISFQKV